MLLAAFVQEFEVMFDLLQLHPSNVKLRCRCRQIVGGHRRHWGAVDNGLVSIDWPRRRWPGRLGVELCRCVCWL